jgi:hypothetical protein
MWEMQTQFYREQKPGSGLAIGCIIARRGAAVIENGSGSLTAGRFGKTPRLNGRGYGTVGSRAH